MNINKIWRY